VDSVGAVMRCCLRICEIVMVGRMGASDEREEGRGGETGIGLVGWWDGWR